MTCRMQDLDSVGLRAHGRSAVQVLGAPFSLVSACGQSAGQGCVELAMPQLTRIVAAVPRRAAQLRPPAPAACRCSGRWLSARRALCTAAAWDG